MSFCGYKYKFGLYASHSNIINSDSNAHFHNFTITLYINTIHNKNDDNFGVEKAVQNWLKPFQGKQLADTQLFDGKETTLEGIGNTFFTPLSNLIQYLGYELIKLDVNENPIRIYSVSSKLLDHTVNQINDIPLECIPSVQISHDNLVLQNDDSLNSLNDDSKDNSQNDNSNDDSQELAAITIEEVELTDLLENRQPIGPSNGSIRRFVLKTSLVMLGLICLSALAYLTITIVQMSGRYPQGSDTFCHLYRADLILKNIKEGNWYPLYDSNWYNGVEIMRYWGPVPLYIIAGIEWITQLGILNAYVIFLGVLIVLGGLGWLLWGIRYNRIGLSIILGLLWFYMPENIRVVIFEGNLPRGVINALLPFFIYFYWRIVADRKRNALCPLIIVTALITLCHIGITIMLLVSIAIFTIFYANMNKSGKWSLYAILASLSGVMLAGVWVVPSLIGGAASGSSTNQVMKNFFESITISLNPLTRINGDTLSFYFGASVFIICIVGMLVGDKKVKAGFITALILYICTTKSVYILFEKLPFSQYLWMIRFIPIALALAMVSFLMWKQLRWWMVMLFCIFLIADCATSIQDIYYQPEQRIVNAQNELDDKAENLLLTKAKDITNQRMAVLDLSKYGSFAPYYIAGVGKNVMYTFGAGWEGASTASNIVNLNGATESGWYIYLFDRALELGNDTVLIPINNLKEKSKDIDKLVDCAKIWGYNLITNNGNSLLFHKDTYQQFGTVTNYENIAIGDSAAGIAMIFPSFEEASDHNINNYSFEYLSKYHIIYLSGITYTSKEKAEELLLKLANSGVQVYIDMNRVPEDKVKKRMELFGVKSQTITFTETFPEFTYDGQTYKSLDFSSDMNQWNTVYLDGLEQADGICDMEEKDIPYIGTSKSKNLHFLGLNFIYYLQTSKDEEINKLACAIFGLDNNIVPDRKVVPININISKNEIDVYSAYDNVNTTLSSIDIFSSKQNFKTYNHLIVVDSGLTVIYINYPHLREGIIVTIMGLGFAIITYVLMRKSKEKIHDDETKEDETDSQVSSM